MVGMPLLSCADDVPVSVYIRKTCCIVQLMAATALARRRTPGLDVATARFFRVLLAPRSRRRWRPRDGGRVGPTPDLRCTGQTRRIRRCDRTHAIPPTVRPD